MRRRRLHADIGELHPGRLRENRRRVASNAEIHASAAHRLQQRRPAQKFCPGHAHAHWRQPFFQRSPHLLQHEIAVFLVADPNRAVLRLRVAAAPTDRPLQLTQPSSVKPATCVPLRPLPCPINTVRLTYVHRRDRIKRGLKLSLKLHSSGEAILQTWVVVSKEGSTSLFEKKKQKTFGLWDRDRDDGPA